MPIWDRLESEKVPMKQGDRVFYTFFCIFALLVYVMADSAKDNMNSENAREISSGLACDDFGYYYSLVPRQTVDCKIPIISLIVIGILTVLIWVYYMFIANVNLKRAAWENTVIAVTICLVGLCLSFMTFIIFGPNAGDYEKAREGANLTGSTENDDKTYVGIVCDTSGNREIPEHRCNTESDKVDCRMKYLQNNNLGKKACDAQKVLYAGVVFASPVLVVIVIFVLSAILSVGG